MAVKKVLHLKNKRAVKSPIATVRVYFTRFRDCPFQTAPLHFTSGMIMSPDNNPKIANKRPNPLRVHTTPQALVWTRYSNPHYLSRTYTLSKPTITSQIQVLI